VDNLRTSRASPIEQQCALNAAVGVAIVPAEISWKRAVRPKWPELKHLGLSEAQRLIRRGGVGGSDANVILSGDATRVRELWLEKRGEASSPDLSDKLAVMLGCWTEAFNRQWYEQRSGQRITRIGRSLVCGRHPWRRCTLDGFIDETAAVWEAKHTSAFAKSEEVLERYMPQLQHNMAVARVERTVLSVIFGNHRYEVFEIASDWLYQLELLEAEEQFWDCVQTGQEPQAMPAPPAPKPVGTREVCLEGNNAWASAAVDWLEHRAAAKTHASACSSIKELVEEDVTRAFGHGIEAKRCKSRAITIREIA
jgi:predicted phage-related endonuclease